MIDNLPLIYIKIRNLKKDIDYYIDSDSFDTNSNDVLNKINEIEQLIKKNLREKNYWIAGISYKELISVLSQYKSIKLIEKKINHLKQTLIDIIYELLAFDTNPIVEIRVINSYSDIIPEIKEIIHKFNNYRTDKYNLYNISGSSNEYIKNYLNYIKKQFYSNLININDVLYVFRINFFEDLSDQSQIKKNIDIFVNFLTELFDNIRYDNIKILQFLTDLFNFYNEGIKEKTRNSNYNYINLYDIYLDIVNKFIINILNIIEFDSLEFKVSFYERIFRFYFKVNDYFKSFILAIIIAYYNYIIKDFYNASLYLFRLCDVMYKFFDDLINKDNDNLELNNLNNLDNYEYINYKYLISLYFLFLSLAFNLYFQDNFNEELKIDLKFNFGVNNFFKNIIFFKKKNYLIKNVEDIINVIFTNEFRDYLVKGDFFESFLNFNKNKNEFNYNFYFILYKLENISNLRALVLDLYDERKYSGIFLNILEFIFKEYFINLN